VVRYAFTSLGLHRLEANIQPANRASLAVVERLSFRREGWSPAFLMVDGKWRDHERWAITAGEVPALGPGSFRPGSFRPGSLRAGSLRPESFRPWRR